MLSKYNFERLENLFTKTFKRIISLSTRSSKLTMASTLSSFKNCLGQLLGLFPVQKTAKAFLW